MSGVLKPGDEISILPSMKTTKVKSIETFDGQMEYAHSPMSITVTLDDEIDISRGDMIVHRHNIPHSEKHFEAMVVWMGDQPLDSSKPYRLKMGAQEERIRFDKIRYGIDVNTLGRRDADGLSLNEIGRAVMTSTKPLFFDPYTKNRSTGSFVIIDPVSNNTVGAGMLLDREPSDKLPSSVDIPSEMVTSLKKRRGLIAERERVEGYGHKSCTVWLTGLVGAGKTKIAYTLERRLFDMGDKCIVLDGENIRLGLSKGLEFTAVDRAEHLRRVAEIAKLMNDAGIIVICSFTSPIDSERREVGDIIGEERFVEVFVDADLEQCEEWDDTGLYSSARKGVLKGVPGVDAPYEVPQEADLVVKPAEVNAHGASEAIVEFMRTSGFIPKKQFK